jgi:hypothetical protein
VLDDPPPLAGVSNGQLRGTPGALGALHDWLPPWGLAQRRSGCGQCAGDVGLLNLVPGRLGGGRGADSVEPEGGRLEFEPSRGLRRGIAELEAKRHGGELGRRTFQQQVGVAPAWRAEEPRKGLQVSSRLIDLRT